MTDNKPPQPYDSLLDFFKMRREWLNIKKVWNENLKGWDIAIVIDGTYYPSEDSFITDADVDLIVERFRNDFIATLKENSK